MNQPKEPTGTGARGDASRLAGTLSSRDPRASIPIFSACSPDYAARIRESFARQGSAARNEPSNPALARLAGRYVNDSPWVGMAIVVERAGKLWIGTETPMSRVGDNLWRVGEESWSPERASFANFIDGRPQTFIFSGEKFLRHDI